MHVKSPLERSFTESPPMTLQLHPRTLSRKLNVKSIAEVAEELADGDNPDINLLAQDLARLGIAAEAL